MVTGRLVQPQPVPADATSLDGSGATSFAAADEARRLAADLIIQPDAIAVIARDMDGSLPGPGHRPGCSRVRLGGPNATVEANGAFG
jgi:hypothetical protein